MDDKFKNLGFRDFVTVDYTMTKDEYLAYQAQKRRRGHFDTYNESTDEIDEVLSVAQRRKASQRMKRMSKRIQVAKKRALKRTPSNDVLKKRANKQARNQMIKKWSRGMDKSEMSPARKAEMEKKLKKMKPRLDRMAQKMVPQLRKMDRERRSGTGKKEDK